MNIGWDENLSLTPSLTRRGAAKQSEANPSAFLYINGIYSKMDELIKGKLERALKVLYSKDQYLIERNAFEPSITAKLSCYLAQEFLEWDVDHEYNLDFNRQDGRKYNVETKKEMRPDIIVHKRDSNKNFIVIELKKGMAADENDEAKLQKLTTVGDAGYNYIYGLHLNIKKQVCQISLYAKGIKEHAYNFKPF